MNEKLILELINQLFEIEKKRKQFGYEKIDKNLERMKFLLNREGFEYMDPTGEVYSETRTDCQATILNDSNQMLISDTIKPVIYKKNEDSHEILQQARVIING